MRRIVLVALMLVALDARSAAAQGGVNLAWGSGCWAENPQVLKTFRCDANAGAVSMVGSFMLWSDRDGIVGADAVIDLEVAAATLPDWWQFVNAGSCRESSLSASLDFSLAPGVSCFEPWPGISTSSTLRYLTATTVPPAPGTSPSRARIVLHAAAAEPAAVTGGTEYYLFRLSFDFQKTMQAGACPGCGTTAALVLSGVGLLRQDGGVDYACTPIANVCISWQFLDPSLCVPPPGGDCQSVPARNPTWGAVKSLYR